MTLCWAVSAHCLRSMLLIGFPETSLQARHFEFLIISSVNQSSVIPASSATIYPLRNRSCFGRRRDLKSGNGQIARLYEKARLTLSLNLRLDLINVEWFLA